MDRHWPIRLDEMLTAYASDGGDLGTFMMDHEGFGHPDHIIFVRAMKLAPTMAAEKFLTVAKRDKNYAWTPAVVELLAALPPEQTHKLLRELWNSPGLEDAVIRVLAVQPDAVTG